MNVIEVKYEFNGIKGTLKHGFKALTPLTQGTVNLALKDWMSKTNTGLPEEFIDHLTSLGFTIKKIG